MPGWIPIDADQWARDRAGIGGWWPEALVVLDLRYWADPIACGRRPRPSVRELAETWGWKRSTAHAFIADGKWKDEFRSGGHSWTTAGHSPDAAGTADAGERRTIGDDSDTRWTPSGHLPDTSRTALRETRARSPAPIHRSTDLLPPNPPSPSAALLAKQIAFFKEWWTQEGERLRVSLGAEAALKRLEEERDEIVRQWMEPSRDLLTAMKHVLGNAHPEVRSWPKPVVRGAAREAAERLFEMRPERLIGGGE